MADQLQDVDVEQQQRQDEEIEALKEEEDAASGPEDARQQVRAQDRSHFFGVANSLLEAIHPFCPQLVLSDNLRKSEADALRIIYEARTAEETETGDGYLSGIERMRYLNEGLRALQHILSLARSPDFPQARPYIEEIRRRVARLRDQIRNMIVSEELKRRKDQDKKELEKKSAEEDDKGKKEAASQAKA